MAAAFTLENVSFHYSEKELLTDASLTLSEGDKAGVVGLNGAGKSTLLKLLSGHEAPDRGIITRKNGLTVSYLPQTPALDPQASIVEQVLSLMGHTDEGEREAAAYEAKTILSKLGFTDFDQRCGQLSGGQQKRVALAAILCHSCDVLLLDEPTNHLDTDMVDELEARLKKFRGTLVMVTHDRYFLERICTRILEVTGGKVESYQTNYQGYLIEKAQREDIAAATLRKRQSLYRTELAWIQRGAQARSTKAKGRIQAFESLKESIQTGSAEKSLEIQSVSSRLGKKILSAEQLSITLGKREIIIDFSYTLLRDDRIGIIGANGAGKTTLLRALMGQIPASSGQVIQGETVKIGHFAQVSPALPPETLVIDAVRNVANRVYTPKGDLSAAQMLETFLFPSGMHYQQVSRLSGGERRRLYLLQVLMAAPNILFLDEPTNDLDIETLTVLEDYLDSFAGAVVAVSHDRYFLDRVTRRLFSLKDGRLTPYEGGYDAYAADRDAQALLQMPKREKEDSVKRERTGAKRKFTFKEQRDFDTIEAVIANLEAQIGATQKEVEANSSNYQRVTELMAKQASLEDELEKAMERWMELQEIFEEIQRNH
ncbi:MAG: ABC-F family ATP-binding cassette domain-containing protein [Clostridia bacterium]|nr:ABC-F family ATP-binding cassette domain-containing protein [Clostridia bacterium]